MTFYLIIRTAFVKSLASSKYKNTLVASDLYISCSIYMHWHNLSFSMPISLTHIQTFNVHNFLSNYQNCVCEEPYQRQGLEYLGTHALLFCALVVFTLRELAQSSIFSMALVCILFFGLTELVKSQIKEGLFNVNKTSTFIAR